MIRCSVRERPPYQTFNHKHAIPQRGCHSLSILLFGWVVNIYEIGGVPNEGIEKTIIQ